MEIQLTEQQAEFIKALNATGLYGFTLEDTAERVLSAGIIATLATCAAIPSKPAPSSPPASRPRGSGSS